MTEKKSFETFMKWMGMIPSKTVTLDGTEWIKYEDSEKTDARFTKVGYDEFKAGAIFDKKGMIIKAYIDSHVAYASENHQMIHETINPK